MNKNIKLTNTQLSALGIKMINNDEEERAKKGKSKDKEFSNNGNK
jgi:uncharacterized protein YwgA